MSVRAILFDFDGTIWDSETASYQSWQATFADFGREFSMKTYSAMVGTIDGADPIAELEAELGHTVDRAAVEERRWSRKLALLGQLRPRPGIETYLHDARARGLARGIVSTSDADFIRRGLEHLELADEFDFVECANGDRRLAKPSPALYLAALERLELPAAYAIAIEDSANGVASAKAAGLFCLAVSNEITRSMDMSAADIVVDSLRRISLADLLARAKGPRAPTL